MMDLQTVNDAHKSFEVSHVALDKYEFNIIDALTKAKTNSILMDTILSRK